MDTTKTAGRSCAAGHTNTLPPAVREKLWMIDSTEGSSNGGGRAARLQATRWLIELDCAECLDETWSKFEAWLREHPDHRAMYLQAGRTRRILDNLGRYCPAEGSAEAQRLLELIHSWPIQRRRRIAMLMWTVVGLLAAIATIIIASH